MKKVHIEDKVYKVVADQAANMKKAFHDTVESNETVNLIELTKNLLYEQKQRDLIVKQIALREIVETDIEEMNKTCVEKKDGTKKRTREELYDDFDEFDDSTENIEENKDSDDSLADADDFSDFDLTDDIRLSNLYSKLISNLRFKLIVFRIIIYSLCST